MGGGLRHSTLAGDPPGREAAAAEGEMRNRLMGAAAALALTATAATAADFGWMGPYLGGNFGYQWGTLTNSGASPAGFSGGGQAGYNWQVGQFVFGLETDMQGSSANATFANYQFSNPWFGTVRGRGGIALDNILFYGTLGLAYGRGELDVAGITESNLHTGFTAGFGLEVGLTHNWSVKAEGLFIDYSGQPYAATGTNNALNNSVARLGVNYRF
jgi:outer membrane immunogenic protein